MTKEKEAGLLEPAPHARDLDSWARYYHDYYPANSRVDLEYRLSRMVVMAGRIWATHADNMLRAEAGQSRARWQTLFAIDFGEQPATMTDIGVRLNVQWPTLVRVLEGLEKDGLISRVDNPRDGRSRLVSITDAGRALLREVQPALDAERARLLAGLSDEELAKCCETLHLLMDRASTS